MEKNHERFEEGLSTLRYTAEGMHQLWKLEAPTNQKMPQMLLASSFTPYTAIRALESVTSLMVSNRLVRGLYPDGEKIVQPISYPE